MASKTSKRSPKALFKGLRALPAHGIQALQDLRICELVEAHALLSEIHRKSCVFHTFSMVFNGFSMVFQWFFHRFSPLSDDSPLQKGPGRVVAAAHQAVPSLPGQGAHRECMPREPQEGTDVALGVHEIVCWRLLPTSRL